MQSNFDWREVLDEFILFKQAEGRSERTIKDYQTHLSAFFTKHPNAWNDFHTLKKEIVKHFASLRDKSPTFYNLRREYLKAFFAWCVREEYLEKNPMDGIHKRRDEGKARNIEKRALEQLLNVCDQKTYSGLRDYALILFQLDTGIRPGEALQLFPEHFNLRTLEATIPANKAKTRMSRIVVYSPQTAKVIQRLLNVRPHDWGNDVPVFASQDGRQMLVNTWCGRLAMYSRKLGIKITPYMLRHTSAITFLRAGGNVFALQRQLGHTNLEMTKRYVHLAQSDLHQQHSIASPVGQLIPQRTRIKKIHE